MKKSFRCVATLVVAGLCPLYGEVTFCNQVVRILQENCQVCHHPGGLGPFSLITYDDAASRARSILSAVTSRRMPETAVVRLETGCSSRDTFEGIRQLTREEIDTIVQWVEGGLLEGDAGTLPAPVSFNDSAVWKAGDPDLIFPNTPGGFLVPGRLGRDIFRRFPIRTYFDADRYMTSFEARPGIEFAPPLTGTVSQPPRSRQAKPSSNTLALPLTDTVNHDLNRIVHHVTLFIDPECNSLQQEKEFAASNPEVIGPGFEGEFMYPAALVGMWFPGSEPLRLQEGVGIKVPKGSCFVMEVHYATYHEVPIVDQTLVGLRFARKPIEKERLAVLVKNEQFTVPAGDPRYKINASLMLKDPITLFSLTPHMHQIGTDFRIEANLPSGEKVCLADVAWDFRHQGTHIFRQPLQLPAGTEVATTCWYDNTADNPHQTSLPPIDVPFGRAADKEMCQLTLGLTFETPR